MQENIELQERISALSNEELGRMLILQAGDYLPEALDIARQEMVKRSLTLDSLTTIIANPPPSIQPEQSQEEKAPRIGGVLILLAIGILINPIFIFTDLRDTLKQMPDRGYALVFGSIDLFLLGFALLLAFRFFTKKRNTPTLAISFYLASLILDFIGGVYLHFKSSISWLTVLGYVQTPLIVSLIWIPYLLLSKRVKRTFVVD